MDATIVLNRGFDLFTGEEAQVAFNLRHPESAHPVRALEISPLSWSTEVHAKRAGT